MNRQMDGTLSGGEMKRLEIATVLAKEHKVSIFDEPEAGIDLWSFSMLIKRFEEIHQEKKEMSDSDFAPGENYSNGR